MDPALLLSSRSTSDQPASVVPGPPITGSVRLCFRTPTKSPSCSCQSTNIRLTPTWTPSCSCQTRSLRPTPTPRLTTRPQLASPHPTPTTFPFGPIPTSATVRCELGWPRVRLRRAIEFYVPSSKRAIRFCGKVLAALAGELAVSPTSLQAPPPESPQNLSQISSAPPRPASPFSHPHPPLCHYPPRKGTGNLVYLIYELGFTSPDPFRSLFAYFQVWLIFKRKVARSKNSHLHI